jgi:hypothetical protein
VSVTLTNILSQDFEAGDVVTYLKDLTVRPQSYATMQCGPGPDDHVMPSGDLRYGVHVLWIALINDGSVLTRPCLRPRTITVNHSCDPNVALDLRSPDRAKWHMVALKRIAVGDPG